MSIFKTEQVDAMLAKYGMAGAQETLMEDWLDTTHGCRHMRWGEYLMYWAEAKEKYLTGLFGGKLIHKFSFTADKSESDLAREFEYDCDFNQNLNRVIDNFEETIRKFAVAYLGMNRNETGYFWRNCRYGCLDVMRNIDIKLSDEAKAQISGFIGAVETIFEVIRHSRTYISNACSSSARFTLPGCRKPFQMCEGQKPIKVLTNFFKYLQPFVVDDNFIQAVLSNVEDLRLRQSQLLNTKSFHGKLCLSIHPMDFMTLSDNGCDWHSCMRWEDAAGEYHAGTLEMMISPSVVVAYLESDRPWEPMCDGRAWSNKKWRELFIVTPDFMAGIKGYPYESDALEAAVLARLSEMAEAIGGNFDNEVQRFDRDGSIEAPNGYSFRFSTEIMYNDTPYTEMPVVFCKNFDKIYPSNRFYYGLGVHCISCGKLRTYDSDNTDRLTCEECDGVRRCYCCGDRCSEDDMITLPDGQMVCQYCYEEHYVTCDVSGEQGLDSDLETIRFSFDYKSRRGCERRGCELRMSLTVKSALVDELPEECIQRSSRWGDPDILLVKPLPQDNELCKRFMEAINEKLDEGETLVYQGVEVSEEGASAASFPEAV